jgi:hypothetical protein
LTAIETENLTKTFGSVTAVRGLDLTVEYRPFGTQVQSITGGEVDTAMVSVLPYLSNYLRGEDLVLFGFDGTLQLINSLYALTDSGYESIQDMVGERIGVWTFGSSPLTLSATLYRAIIVLGTVTAKCGSAVTISANCDALCCVSILPLPPSGPTSTP